MGKANHENNENWIPTNKKYFTVYCQGPALTKLKAIKIVVYRLGAKKVKVIMESIDAVHPPPMYEV